MNEQGTVLFFNEDDRVRELATTDADEPDMSWEVETDALRDLAVDVWQIEGPFRMCSRAAGLSKVWFRGYGLTRKIQ